MGYTHHWYRPLNISAELFQTIRLDFERLVLPLADCGVHLAAGLGKGVPVITNDNICFNGVRSCGHPKNDEIVIPYPTDDACGVGPSANALHYDQANYWMGIAVSAGPQIAAARPADTGMRGRP